MPEDSSGIGWAYFGNEGQWIADEAAVRAASRHLFDKSFADKAVQNLDTASTAISAAIGHKYGGRGDNLNDPDLPDFPEATDFFIL